MCTTIITDHKWKPFKYGNEVPKHVRNDFDWVDEEVNYDDFLFYRGRWYHTSEFMRVNPNSAFALLGYDGYLGDSYFSGVLIKLSDDGEAYKIATYIS